MAGGRRHAPVRAHREGALSARRRAARAACALAFALSLSLRATGALAAEEGAGTRAASFLSAGTAPSALAMGGAALALGRDVQGATLNPAALGWVATPQFALSHADFADQTAQEWVAFGGRIGSSRTRIGVAAVIRDEGTIEGRDANGVPTADVRARDLALTLQLARTVGQRLALGGAAHVVNQSIGDASASGLAFDAGAQLRLGLVSLAVAGQNFGGGMNWNGRRWSMPAQFATGLALELPASGLRLALDWTAPADYYRSVRVGAEWRWHERFALRGGWRGELGAPPEDRAGGPAFGIGAGAGALWFDYGYVLTGDGSATHRVGLSLRGRPAAPSSPPAAR